VSTIKSARQSCLRIPHSMSASQAHRPDGSSALEATFLDQRAWDLARGSKDYAGAEALHLQALSLRKKNFDKMPKEMAITLNSLGEQRLKLGKLEEAEDNFRKAVDIRNVRGPQLEAAYVRDNLAKVLEAKGNFAGARETRLLG
jgi:tetratricopeptide (TPR) repeat protein